ncbi:MAG: hypothetical protein P9X26_06400 [Candidatus Stygibacter frigidus]|nr:hypothetical protein [Candidatus Stygibacter frigidus]
MSKSKQKSKELSKSKQQEQQVEQVVETLENLPDEAREKVASVLIAHRRVSPFVPPKEAEVYEKLCPGFLNRTLSKFEENVNHNMDMERSYFKENSKLAEKGMVFGFIIILFSMLLIPLMAYLGYPHISWGASGIGFLTVIGSFVTKQLKK